MYVQAPVMHQHPGQLPMPHHLPPPPHHRMPPPPPQFFQPPPPTAANNAMLHPDSPCSSGASSQPSPTRTPPLMAGTSFYLPMPIFQQQQQQQQTQQTTVESGYASQPGSLPNSPVSSANIEQQQQQSAVPLADQLNAAGLLMQPPVQQLMLPSFGPLPMQFAAAAAAAAAAASGCAGGPQFPPASLPLPPPPHLPHQLLLPPPPPPPVSSTAASCSPAQAAAAAAAFLQQQQQQQQQLMGCPVFEQDLPDSCRLHTAAAFRAYNFGSHVPPFDIVKWYSEKPPFILDGRTACLYKMREIDRKLPANLVLSADAEYNTVLAEYYILRNMFGPEYSLHDNVFIKLNRSKEGDLAKFIHIFFRERQDAEIYMANAHKFGALTPAWSNPRSFSKNNVYITSVPYYLLSKESLCAYVREFVLGRGPGAADPIKRARVDAEKRSAQVEFHRSEDANALIAYFYQHIPEANARPAFDNAKEQKSSDSAEKN
ncbi:hypothetical protein BOX15_Mlig022844g2 [Macrostomum lignano]|uniref:Uncharacterized protein n=1 Tax=Macrostomum lignano TaxID=282301 RepID=A0A267GT19_9PLAT|nr:hypothetical protein BOX15_Mlig022844g2 [Macrostomum lignano]